MKNLFVSALCTLVCCSLSFAQATFQKAFYAPNYSFGASDVLKTSDNNFLFAASRSTLSGLKETGVLLKTDMDGNELWKLTCGFGFTGSLTHVAELDEYYYGVGSINTGVVFSCPLIKITENGTMIWQKRIDFRDVTTPATIVPTNDDNLLIAGTADDDSTAAYSFLMKVDTAGTVLWKKTYTHSTTMDFNLHDAIVNSDSTMYIVGDAQVAGSPSVVSFVARLNKDGNELWSKRIQGGNSFIGLQKVLPTTGNGCFIAGTNDATGSNIFLAKLDNTGVITWSKVYSVPSGEATMNNMEYHGGDIVFSGVHTTSNGSVDKDLLVFRVSLNGSLLKSNTIGTGLHEEAFDIIPYNGDGRLLISGSTQPVTGGSGLLITITKSNLSATCNNSSMMMTGTNLAPISAAMPLTIGTAGAITASNFNSPAVTLQDTMQCSTVGIDDAEEGAFVLYPNPSSGELHIQNSNFKTGDRLQIFDLLGKEVFATHLSTATFSLNIQDAGLEDGIYVVQWTAGKAHMRKKFILQR